MGKITGHYAESKAYELIQKMLSSGLLVDHGLAAELSGRGDAVPYLIEILRRDEYWEKGGPGDGWAPIHAIHLLGAIKTDECLPALIDTIRHRGEELGDWLTEDMPSILANFGLPAAEPLKAMTLDKELDAFSRGVAVSALAAIAHERGEIRSSVIELLRKIIREEKDPELVALVINDLAQFKDPDALADIKSLFDRGLVAENFINWRDVKRIHDTPEVELEYHKDLRDPLDHFLPKNLMRLWDESYGGKVAHFVDASGRIVYQEKPKKPSRNDPCPCGSGKKYKKCCMLKELGVGPTSPS